MILSNTDRTNEIAQVLTVMDSLATKGVEWVHCSDLANWLRDNKISDIHWRRIQSILDDNREYASRRKRKNRFQYKLLEAGYNYINGSPSDVVLIDPNKAIQNVVTLHKALSELSGQVRICDPYIESASIEHLDALPANTHVEYLTYQFKNEGALRRTVAAFASTGRSIEIRKIPKAEIHDRYLIDKRKLMILGASLNGFGKKQSFIVFAGQQI